MLACQSGSVCFEIVKYLVQNGADVNAKCGSNNKTALMFAQERFGQFKIVNFLAENGADVSKS